MSDDNLHEVEITVQAPRGEDTERIILPELEKLPAVVKSIKPKQSSKGIRANFCFELKGEYVGQYAWGSVPHREVLSEDSHLYQWSAAILNKQFGIGDNFKLKELVGRKVFIVIENSPSDDAEKPYQNVIKVLYRDTIDAEVVSEPVSDDEIEESLTESVTEQPKEEVVEEEDDDDFDLFD